MRHGFPEPWPYSPAETKEEPGSGLLGHSGGKVDFLETAEQAVRREALEETGLEAGVIRLLGLSEQLFHEEGQHWLGILFLAETYSGEAQLLEPEKHGGLGWFPLDDLPAKVTLPTTHAIDLMRKRECPQG